MASMKLAIVGGGPSGFYVASRILSLLPRESLNIHIYDRLWSPHGLVRYGVAPDHPEVKNCVHKFDEAAMDSRLRFFGNVNVGKTSGFAAMNIPLKSLFSNYTHLLFASGCSLPNLHPSLPPSSTCIPAISLVHWYTNHPSNPTVPPLDKTSHVSIIGAGNVSLDIARILLTSPHVLAKYDVPNRVLDVLSHSAVKHVSIIARRGPLEAAFTTKELREMMNLPEASMMPVQPPGVLENPGALREGGLSRQQSRILDLLRKGSKNAPGSTEKSWSLDFFKYPISLTPPSPSSSLSDLTLAHTTLDPATSRAVPTGETSTIPTSLVITSLGFHADPSSPAPEFYNPELGHLRTLPGGRVSDETGTVMENIYASGWTANGAKGVLARTMVDAYAVADTIVSDYLGSSVTTTPASCAVGSAKGDGVSLMNSSVSASPDPPPEIIEGLERRDITTYEDWKVIDAEEVRRGKEARDSPAGVEKERERMGWEEAQDFLLNQRRS